MDRRQADEYLARFGASRDTPLTELQALHLRHVPFENLDIHLGRTIMLDPDELFDKIVRRRRGGFCYELNGLFAELLVALGATVHRLGSRVWGGGRFGPPLDHMQLVVTGPGEDEPRLMDVGFGRFATDPLRWRERVDQADPTGTYRLTDTDDGLVDIAWNGTPTCRTDPRPLALDDFAAMCWYQQTSPASHFTQGPACSRLDEGDASRSPAISSSARVRRATVPRPRSARTTRCSPPIAGTSGSSSTTCPPKRTADTSWRAGTDPRVTFER